MTISFTENEFLEDLRKIYIGEITEYDMCPDTVYNYTNLLKDV